MIGSAEALLLVLTVLVMLVGGGYWLWMLVDVVRTHESRLRAGTTLVWVLAIVLGSVPGAVLYHVLGRPRRA